MLRGTFAGAYNLLTKLVSKIGWDELLRCRSLVFVMEEEYRAQKEAEEEFRKKTHNNVYAPVNRSSERPKQGLSQHLDPGASVPTIKISTESERGREEAEEIENEQNSNKDDADQSMKDVPLDDLSLDDQKDYENENKEDPPQEAINEKTTKPEEAHEGLEDSESEKDIELSFSFSHKRLCDRWLDNLFMVLYEDLRQYAVWRAEVQHYLQARTPYRKSGGEWQIYGDLAMRLHHRLEALEAYQECVAKKFSPKALYQLLEIYADDGQVLKAMDAAIRLCVYQERWYQEAVVGFAFDEKWFFEVTAVSAAWN